MTKKQRITGFIGGIALALALGVSAMLLSKIDYLKNFGLSPLTIAIILGMILGNIRLFTISGTAENGVHFVQKRLLRAGIILYGFRITFQEIAGVGTPGFLIDLIVITTTFLIGTYAGVKIFKLDLETSILNSSGSSICGAAAVIATEGVVQGGSKKTAVAVSTVVLFGTLSMFLYPVLYSIANIPPETFGIYIGSTIHEVAQVVVAGETLGPDVASTAVIVKMTRVMMLAPFLILLGWYLTHRKKNTQEMADKGNTSHDREVNKPSIVIPWFAVGFIGVSILNSLVKFPSQVLAVINGTDTLLLSAAMAALGIGTNYHKMKGVGIRPFLHGAFLFIFLVFAGYGINHTITGLFR